jgi:hypothetical protein
MCDYVGIEKNVPQNGGLAFAKCIMKIAKATYTARPFVWPCLTVLKLDPKTIAMHKFYAIFHRNEFVAISLGLCADFRTISWIASVILSDLSNDSDASLHARLPLG